MTVETQVTTDARWVPACTVDDLEEDEGLRIGTTPPVAVFLTGDEIFCVDDTCTHETFPLSEGWVENCVVECPLHSAKFDLRTGAVLSPPAHQAVCTHPVRVEDGTVFVQLPGSYAAALEGRQRDGLS
ncbi:bifunctional 3-phenylpropionate/cinnamic acid dioxygenase ferredoxin subunit [Streptomyces sp. NPDC091215]|uniref:bifunctional 3-phenylpropionate/cinnamic acid dioxygenase ferredoxin subunit n=1 Tax=Streptomyces sp. NPDC091215 TaxID=3155192 RepID=UPI0034141B8C